MPNQQPTLSRGRQILVKKLCLLTFSIASFNTIHSQDVLQVQNGASIRIENGAAVTLEGGIRLDNGSTLTNNGVIQLNKAGNWTDLTNKPYYYGTGKVIFHGSEGHAIDAHNVFERIEIDATGHVSLTSDVNATNWYFIQGRVNTGIFRAIVIGNSSLAIAADPSNTGYTQSWINGNMRRYLDPVSDNDYTFPIGDATNVKRVVLDNFSSQYRPGYIDASFAPGPIHDAGFVIKEDGQSYGAMHGGGVWNLVPDKETGKGTYDLRVYLDGFTGLSDNGFAVLGRPVSSYKAADWSVPSGSNLPAADLPGRIVSAGYAGRDHITGFGQFGIGLLTKPLPFIRAERGVKVSVVLFPNPNNGQFSLRLDGADRTYDAIITDMNGKMIRQLKLVNNNSVNISGLSAGTYIISIPHVFGMGESFTERVIVIR